MLNRFEKIRALYDGPADGGTNEPPDPEPRGDVELESFRELKHLLDARPRRRPDRQTIESIMAAARGEPVRLPTGVRLEDGRANPGPRPDREPVARRRTVKLHVGAASAIVLVLLMVAGLLNVSLFEDVALRNGGGVAASTQPAEGDHSDAQTEFATRQPAEQAADAEASSRNMRRQSSTEIFKVQPNARSYATPLQESWEPRTVGREPRAVERDPASAQSPDYQLVELEEDDLLEWDRRGEMIEMFQDIERIHGGVEMGWDPPAIPLEMMPVDQSDYPNGILPAGNRRMP